MPNQPKTQLRTFRAGREYDEARRIAEGRGENISEHVLRPALLDYIARFGRPADRTVAQSNDGEVMTKSDRRVHCTIVPVGGGRIEIVRYERAGKWWREDGGRRTPLNHSAGTAPTS